MQHQELPAEITYSLHTEKICRIINCANRITFTRTPDPKQLEEYQQLVSVPIQSPARLPSLVKVFCKFRSDSINELQQQDKKGNVAASISRDYSILHEICLTAIGRNMERLPMGGAVEGQPRVELTLEDMILLSSQRKPIPHTAMVLFQFLQGRVTRLTAFKKNSFEEVTVSIAAFTRHLIRGCRETAKKGSLDFSYFDQLPPDQKLATYSGLVEFLQYNPVPVKEAKLSITCCLDDLAEWTNVQKKIKNNASAPADKKMTQAEIMELSWRFSRPMRSLLWSTIANLMAYPPQEGQEAPAESPDEKERPTTVEDPETGYWVNHGDAYLKAHELALPENEVEGAREQLGLHSLEFSALGFPQLFPPSLGELGVTSTILAVGGMIAGIIGMRMWAFGGGKN